MYFGGRNAPTMADGAGFDKLSQALTFSLKFKKRIGNELFLVYRAVRKKRLNPETRLSRI